MELELKKEHYACYQACPEQHDMHEESTETIVPDYCPDVARIVDADACLLIRRCEHSDGKASVSALVRVNVLYMTEDAKGLRSLTYTLPIEHTFEGKLSERCAEIDVSGSVESCDVRLLNPRKLLTRVAVSLTLRPYERVTLSPCAELEPPQDCRVETLCESCEAELLCAVREKEFTVAEELTLPGGREPIRELLRSGCEARLTECKCVGGKILLKGVASVSILYLSDSGSVLVYEEEIPFSQIAEGTEDGSDADCEYSVTLTGCEIVSGGEEGDDGRTVTVKLFLRAFLMLRSQETIRCITDLYSTTHDLTPRTEELMFTRSCKRLICRASVREQVDTGVDIGSILRAAVDFSDASVTQNEDVASLRATAVIRMLYLDENGVPLLSEKRCEVTAEEKTAPGSHLSLLGVSCAEVDARANATCAEVRFTAEFSLLCCDNVRMRSLSEVTVAERTEEEGSAPSLVLRAIGNGEKLWDLAKHYRTTVVDILEANELAADAAVPTGQMLLIPRSRA